MRDQSPIWAQLVAAHPPLPKADQLALARRAKAGDARARDRLVLSQIGLVLQRAHALAFTGVPLDDLAQTGIESLMRALRTFDPERNTTFTTHAIRWLQQMTGRAVSGEEQLVKAPSRLRRGSAITLVAKESLDEPVMDGSRTTRGEMIEDGSEPVDEALARVRLVHAVRQRTDRMNLHPTDRDIMTSRLSADEPEPRANIAARHGYSREWIRRREQALRARLAVVLEDVKDAAA